MTPNGRTSTADRKGTLNSPSDEPPRSSEHVVVVPCFIFTSIRVIFGLPKFLPHDLQRLNRPLISHSLCVELLISTHCFSSSSCSKQAAVGVLNGAARRR